MTLAELPPELGPDGVVAYGFLAAGEFLKAGHAFARLGRQLSRLPLACGADGASRNRSSEAWTMAVYSTAKCTGIGSRELSATVAAVRPYFVADVVHDAALLAVRCRDAADVRHALWTQSAKYSPIDYLEVAAVLLEEGPLGSLVNSRVGTAVSNAVLAGAPVEDVSVRARTLAAPLLIYGGVSAAEQASSLNTAAYIVGATGDLIDADRLLQLALACGLTHADAACAYSFVGLNEAAAVEFELNYEERGTANTAGLFMVTAAAWHRLGNADRCSRAFAAAETAGVPSSELAGTADELALWPLSAKFWQAAACGEPDPTKRLDAFASAAVAMFNAHEDEETLRLVKDCLGYGGRPVHAILNQWEGDPRDRRRLRGLIAFALDELDSNPEEFRVLSARAAVTFPEPVALTGALIPEQRSAPELTGPTGLFG